jgi:Ni/Co efflux regulator RcnB
MDTQKERDMKRTLTAVLAATIGLSGMAGAAAAQPYGHDQNRGYDRHDDRGYDHRRDDRHDNGRHHGWRRGERIGHDEWVRYQRVDWRHHHLRRPPRGYEWRQTDDGNYVLAAVATGLIASIIANSR